MSSDFMKLCFIGFVSMCWGTPVRNSVAMTNSAPEVKSYRDPQPEDVEFWLFTRGSLNQVDGKQIVIGDIELQASTFDPCKKTVMVVHGFWEDMTDTPWMHNIKNEMLKKDDYNVFIVQWASLSTGLRYNIAASNAIFTGGQIADMLEFIKETYPEFNVSQVYLVGFSLGAHAVGEAGRKVPGVGRITGLDPAGPDFENEDPSNRLDPTDATFVDIIHTNGGHMLTGHFGCKAPLGHVDFYVNGGQEQPGCPNFIWEGITDIIELKPGDIDPCNHLRATLYFIESINSQSSYAYQCNSYHHFNSNLPGDLETNAFWLVDAGDRYRRNGDGQCFDQPSIPFGYPSQEGLANANINKSSVFYLNTRDETPFLVTHLQYIADLGETARNANLYVTPLVDHETQETIDLMAGRGIIKESVVSGKITVPAHAQLNNLHIKIEYDNPILPGHGKYILSTFKLQNPATNETICYQKNMELFHDQPQIIMPVHCIPSLHA